MVNVLRTNLGGDKGDKVQGSGAATVGGDSVRR